MHNTLDITNEDDKRSISIAIFCTYGDKLTTLFEQDSPDSSIHSVPAKISGAGSLVTIHWFQLLSTAKRLSPNPNKSCCRGGKTPTCQPSTCSTFPIITIDMFVVTFDLLVQSHSHHRIAEGGTSQPHNVTGQGSCRGWLTPQRAVADIIAVSDMRDAPDGNAQCNACMRFRCDGRALWCGEKKY